MASPKELFGRKMEQEIHHEKLPQPVYYIESPDDDTVLVGVDVEIKQVDNEAPVISWYDTIHERTMPAVEMVKKDDYFAFRRADKKTADGKPAEYYFMPMNLQLYNDKVKFQLKEGKEFNNTEDMVQAFIEAARENGRE